MYNEMINNKAERFNTATCFNLFDKIPDWRLDYIHKLTNDSGMDIKILRDSIEIASEDPKKIKRLGELLTVISERTKYADDGEEEVIPEKIRELIELVK